MKDFNTKIEEQLRLLSFSDFDDSKEHYHTYADFAELICIRSNDYVSPSDILQRIKGNGIIKEKRKLDGEIGQDDAEHRDIEESWITVVFEYLNQRTAIYKESYPFTIDRHGIKLKSNNLTSSQKIYVYLLISSSLKYFKKVQHELTSEFEIISESVLKAFLPQAKVYGFGSNSKFTGNAKNKINNLAKEINVDVRARVINQISKYNSKEEGLDVVAWIPFKDNNPNTLVILGQCACGQNWINKQNETKRYDRFYDSYILPFIHALFLPHDLRNNKGRFELDKDINNNTLVFERRRILEYSEDIEFNDSFKSKVFVDKCIEFQEDIV